MRLAMLVGGFAVGLVVCELLLRLLGVSYFRVHLFDENLGWVRPPGASGWYVREGRAFIQINRDGLRDRQHERAKPPGVFRVAVLGDSFAEALSVPIEQTFWAELERQLPSCPALGGRSVEVINFGFSGYGTGQQLIALRTRGWDYDPDAVVVAMYLGNDIHDNSRALAREPLRPYFVRQGGSLVIDNAFRLEPDYLARQTAWARFFYSTILPNVRLLQVIQEARVPGAVQEATVRYAAAGTVVGPDGKEYPASIYREPIDPDWREAWAVTEDLLVAIRDEVRDHRATLLIATIGEPLTAHPDPHVRERYRSQLAVADFSYPDARIDALGRRAGIPVLNLAREFRLRGERDAAYLYGYPPNLGEGHWNPDGHRLAGSLMSESLCRALARI